jgi:hypothetical protein
LQWPYFNTCKLIKFVFAVFGDGWWAAKVMVWHERNPESSSFWTRTLGPLDRIKFKESYNKDGNECWQYTVLDTVNNFVLSLIPLVLYLHALLQVTDLRYYASTLKDYDPPHFKFLHTHSSSHLIIENILLHFINT